ncbi:MAG: hypothetical protein HRT58_04580 [Crocinitomicaceae bacterium]|nr:hypothetical protein [Flavobacteriales bacterium]NQZ34913.1 hypothetical protein [Crocinitomicaceae bacterium]
MQKLSLQERRNKLMEQFHEIIQDEEKMNHLEGIFTDILGNSNSTLSEKQWQVVEDRHAEYKAGKIFGSSWSEVKAEARSKNEV